MLEAGRKGALVGMEQVFGPCCSKGTGTASDQGLSCFEVPAQNATHQGTGALQLTHQNALRATHWFHSLGTAVAVHVELPSGSTRSPTKCSDQDSDRSHDHLFFVASWLLWFGLD